MRFWVRAAVEVNLSFGVLRAERGAPDAMQTIPSFPTMGHIPIQYDSVALDGQQEKRILARTPLCVTKFRDVASIRPHHYRGILTSFPFEQLSSAVVFRAIHILRLALSMSNSCSHGALLHFGHQGSHETMRYYHQDLHPPLLIVCACQQIHYNSCDLQLNDSEFRCNDWVSDASLSAIHFRG